MNRLNEGKISFALENGSKSTKRKFVELIDKMNYLANECQNTNQLQPFKTSNDAKSDSDEPLSKTMKRILPPSNEEVLKYVKNVVDNADLETVTLNMVFENVCLRFPNLRQSKYLIERMVESHIIDKHLKREEENEPKKSKKNVEPFQDNIDLKSVRLRHDAEKDFISEEVENAPECPDLNKGKEEVTSKSIELFQIGEGEIAIQNYFDLNGYVYSIKRRSKTTIYMRCKNYVAHECKASVIVRENNFTKAIVKHNHNHSSVKKDLDRVKFNKKLEQICRAEPFVTARGCYHRAKKALGTDIDRKHIPSLKSFESLIYRLQKVDIPPLPKTIDDLEKLILDLKYGKKFSHDEHGQILFRGVWRGTTGDSVAFISETTLQEVRKLKHLELLMDGTFKVLPCHIKFVQLYIINVIIEDRSYPLAYILMERRDTLSYEVVFNKIKALISSTFKSISCMTDYEAATRKAFKKVYPEANIYGCFFHYVQAITKRFRKFKLNQNDEFNLTMQKISALALLPNDFVVAGFEIIAKQHKKSKIFAKFANYWRGQWAKANISVYGLKNRTNNFAESLNKTINLLIGNLHPHIWRLLYNLSLVEADRSDELLKIVAGDMIDKRRSKAMKKLDKKIKDATKRFDDDENVARFLDRVTFNEDFKIHFKERIFIDGIDSKEFDNNDDDDDEVIPNNFLKIFNFRKSFPRKCSSKNKTK